MGTPRRDDPFNLADYVLFDRLAEGLGDTVALRFGDQAHTYAEVAEQTRALSAHLIGAGVGREARVLVVLPDTPAFAWAIFATLRAGAVLAMGNPAADNLRDVLDYTHATALVTVPSAAKALHEATIRAGVHVVVAADAATGDDVLAPPQQVPPEAVPLADALADGRARIERGAPSHRDTIADAPAIWLFTSGSTGRSRAAMHAHADFAFNTERYAVNTVGYRRGDVTVSVPRLYFGYATGTNLFFPFRVGATVGLFSERPTPARLAAAITEYRPSIVTNVPTMMAKLLDADDAQRREGGASTLDLSSVRFHLSAGEALPPALLERFCTRFGGEVYDGIGSAEMFHIYCTNRPGDVKPGSLGRAVEGYTLRVLPVDAEGPGAAEVAVGETGVLWVKGDSVAWGYYGDRARSFRTFFGHWCRTGDLFRRDADGYYWFEGRSDDLLKVGGIWVAPLEVEHCLTEHEAVSAAAVIGAEREAGLVKPKAIVTLRPDHRPATDADAARLAQALKEHVQTRLSKHKYPRWVCFVDTLPKNDRGKIDRKELLRREAAGDNPPGW
ncbi:MAG: benzoate-CoA ligase family protein [Myxococcota bacterium]